jgi:glycosyltransferase involved in cell wall biosynthesis
MKILLNADGLSSDGGLQMNVFQVSRELASRGHVLDLLYVEDGDLGDEYRSFCRSVVRVPTFAFKRHRALRDLVRLAPSIWQGARRRPDVVYLNRFPQIGFGVLTGWVARAPVVCHLHYVSDHESTRLMGSKVRRFIAVSHAQREDWVRAGLNPEWIDVVYNGVDPASYPPGGPEERRRAREKLGLPPDGFIVLYCGRMSPEKGVEVLLDAWRQLGLDPDKNRLLLQGDPIVPSPYPLLVQHQRELHEMAPPGCDWLPMHRDVVTPMHAADVVVLPSRSESFGRTAVEALATGRPILGSRVGGIPEVLTGPFERFLFPDGDASALADSLASLVGWQEREPTLADACVDHVRTHFTLQQTVDGVERTLMEVAGGR